MARDGSGNYTLPVNSWNPATNGSPATAADWQSLINDVASAVSASVAKDGQTAMTGDLSLGGNKITNLDPGTATTDAVNKNQLNTLDSTGISTYMKTVLDDADAATAQTTLGGTAIGKALFTAADAAAVRVALDMSSGTWTPAVVSAIGTATAGSVSSTVYTRIGNTVFITGRYSMNTTGSGIATLDVQGPAFVTDFVEGGGAVSSYHENLVGGAYGGPSPSTANMFRINVPNGATTTKTGAFTLMFTFT